MTSLPPTSPTSAVAATAGRLRLRDRLSGFLWPLIWAAILATAGGVSLRAVSVMTQSPPLPDCAQAMTLNADNERLLCAQASVRSGSAQALIEAIELVEPWRPRHPLYDESNRLMNRWSRALLAELEKMVQRGELQRAIALAGRIPERVEIYAEVKSALATWDKEWTVGQEVEAKILAAIEAKNWSAARHGLQDLKILGSNYWVRRRHDQLKSKVDREEMARRQLEKARSLIKTGDMDKMGEALALAKGINLKTTAWTEAKPDLDQWAEQVLQYSFRKWEEEDIEAAIAVVQLVPPDLAVTAEAKDLISFGHAKRLAKGHYDQWEPSYAEIYNLNEAIQAVQRISPDSPFYWEAQNSLSKWRKKLEDVTQLQYATTLAQVGHRVTYRMAIAEAQTITQERPQRVQAQTLVSHWQKEIERIEDRPILTEAVKLATAGGKANLQKAIAKASEVELGRALRIEGQTYIAEWEDRIEIIEDQPIMAKAGQLAETGELALAIEEAQKVAEGRALHDDAQTAIQAWTDELQILEDQPILYQAESLALRGRLTDAIEVASQIAPGRVLYPEARTNIVIWLDERDYLWSLQAPPAERDYRQAETDWGYADGYVDDF